MDAKDASEKENKCHAHGSASTTAADDQGCALDMHGRPTSSMGKCSGNSGWRTRHVEQMREEVWPTSASAVALIYTMRSLLQMTFRC